MDNFEVRTRTLLALKSFMYATTSEVLRSFMLSCYRDKLDARIVHAGFFKAGAEINKLMDQGFVHKFAIDDNESLIGLTPEGYRIII